MGPQERIHLSLRLSARRVVRVAQSPTQLNMSRAPLYALTAAVFAIAAVAIVTSPEPRIALAVVPPAPPIPDGPPSTASALAGAVEASVLTELEVSLTEEAASRSTSTTSSTTTTVAAETTDTASETESAPAESPPSDQPAATTTTTTAPTPTTTEAPPEPPPEGYFDAGAESDFAGRIAAIRSANGKAGLSRDGSLDAYARSWAKQMGESGSLAHSNTGALMPPWAAVAENVGQGGSVSQVFDLFVGSSGHLGNMIGDFTHMGIGVWRDPGGTIWTAHVFARS